MNRPSRVCIREPVCPSAGIAATACDSQRYKERFASAWANSDSRAAIDSRHPDRSTEPPHTMHTSTSWVASRSRRFRCWSSPRSLPPSIDPPIKTISVTDRRPSFPLAKMDFGFEPKIAKRPSRDHRPAKEAIYPPSQGHKVEIGTFGVRHIEKLPVIFNFNLSRIDFYF